MNPTARYLSQATLPPPSAQPADGAVRLIPSLQNPVSTGFCISNRPTPVIDIAQAAIDLVVNAASPSAAARRSFTTCAANPRSSLVAHSHVLTHTASACRVSVSSRADALAARLENSVNCSDYYQLHSTPRIFHAGYMCNVHLI
jgi:hypothetical protein